MASRPFVFHWRKMQRVRIWIFLAVVSSIVGCNSVAPVPSIPPSKTFIFLPTRTETPTIIPTLALPSTFAPTLEARIQVEQFKAILDCENTNGYIKCYDENLKISFEYLSVLWDNLQPIVEWGETGYSYKYFTGSSPDWPVAGGVSRDYSAGREGSIFDFGIGQSTDSAEVICEWFSTSACYEVKPNVFLAIKSSDANRVCQEAQWEWGLWYPSVVVAIIPPDGSIVSGFAFIDSFLSQEDLAKPYGYLGITDEIGPLNCKKNNIDEYNQFFQELMDGNWENVSYSAKKYFDLFIHLAESVEFR
jgi:hypothetical protein